MDNSIVKCFYCNEQGLIYCSLCKRELKRIHSLKDHHFTRFYCKNCHWRKYTARIKIGRFIKQPIKVFNFLKKILIK